MAIYSEFSYKKWWFPLVMLVYQRVTIGRYIYSYLQWMDSSWNMNGIIMELWDHTIPCHQTWQWTSIRNRGFNGTFIYQCFFFTARFDCRGVLNLMKIDMITVPPLEVFEHFIKNWWTSNSPKLETHSTQLQEVLWRLGCNKTTRSRSLGPFGHLDGSRISDSVEKW